MITPIESSLSELGYNATSLQGRVGRNIENSSRYDACIDSIGDGNCGPRSIIQALLLHGILGSAEQQQFVTDFLKRLYDDFCDDPRMTKDYSNERFTAAKETETYPLQYSTQKRELAAFIRNYGALSKTRESLSYLQSLMPISAIEAESRRCSRYAEKDYLLFSLAAYLRFDMKRYFNEVSGPVKDLLDIMALAADENDPDIGELHTNIDMGIFEAYLSAKGITLEKYAQQQRNISKQEPLSAIAAQKEQTKKHLSIAMCKVGPHFVMLVDSKEDRLRLEADHEARGSSEILSKTPPAPSKTSTYSHNQNIRLFFSPSSSLFARYKHGYALVMGKQFDTECTGLVAFGLLDLSLITIMASYLWRIVVNEQMHISLRATAGIIAAPILLSKIVVGLAVMLALALPIYGYHAAVHYSTRGACQGIGAKEVLH